MKLLSWSGCGAFVLSLAGFIYSGYFSRYTADDYCNGLYGRVYGFWQGQINAWHTLQGRFTATLLADSFDFFSPLGPRLATGAVIILWTVGMALFFLRARRFLPFKVPAFAAWLCSMLVVLSSIVGTPTRMQSVYWLNGITSFTFPMVFFSFLLWVGIVPLERQRSGTLLWLSVVGCVLFAFLASGCAETFSAFEIVFLLFAAAGFIFLSRGWLRGRALFLLSCALVGALAALALIWLSPTTQRRQAYFPPPPDFITLVRYSIVFAKDFISSSFFQKKLVTLITMGIPALVMFCFCPPDLARQGFGSRLKWWQWLIALALVLLVGYGLMVAICAPSAYAESSYPEKRDLMMGRFSLVITMVMAGGVIGLWIRHGLNSFTGVNGRMVNILAGAVLGLMCLYSLVISYQINTKDIPPRQTWAAAWDKRDAQIRAAVQRGETTVQVVELDSWETLYEMGSTPNQQWVNSCAAKYYGLQKITTYLP
jgi:hypothetical protein